MRVCQVDVAWARSPDKGPQQHRPPQPCRTPCGPEQSGRVCRVHPSHADTSRDWGQERREPRIISADASILPSPGLLQLEGDKPCEWGRGGPASFPSGSERGLRSPSPLPISPLPILPGCPVPWLQMSPWGPPQQQTQQGKSKSRPTGSRADNTVTVHILHPRPPALRAPPPPPTPPPSKPGWGPFQSSWGWAVPPDFSFGRGQRERDRERETETQRETETERERERETETERQRKEERESYNKRANMCGKEPLCRLGLVSAGLGGPGEPRSGSFQGWRKTLGHRPLVDSVAAAATQSQVLRLWPPGRSFLDIWRWSREHSPAQDPGKVCTRKSWA